MALNPLLVLIRAMSALGQKRTFRAINCDVCFTSKADIGSCERNVRFVPIADIALINTTKKRAAVR